MQNQKTINLIMHWLVLLVLVLVLPLMSVQAAEDKTTPHAAVYIQQVDKPVSAVYDALYKSLEEAHFYVVFEPDIGKNLARFSEKWGENYNRNKLSEIRSMVFCNGWYANKVSNLDPDMLGFCPLHLTLIERDGKTTVLFNRPAVMAKNSPAKALFEEIEGEVITAIKQGLK